MIWTRFGCGKTWVARQEGQTKAREATATDPIVTTILVT